MENKYISFEQIARHRLQVTYPNDYHNGWNDAIDVIFECQPADVQEVKHGYWVDTTAYCGEFTCSICKEMCVTNKYKYCPHCGTKMDGIDK